MHNNGYNLTLKIGEGFLERGRGQIVGRVNIPAPVVEVAKDRPVVAIEGLFKGGRVGYCPTPLMNQSRLQKRKRTLYNKNSNQLQLG